MSRTLRLAGAAAVAAFGEMAIRAEMVSIAPSIATGAPP